LNDDTPLKEYDNMVVQTEQAARQMVADAYTAGAKREYELSVHGCSYEPDKEEYLTQLFGEGQAIEKHSNMVVLTKEQYEADKKATAADAFVAGVLYEKSNKFPDLKEYLTEIFGEGKDK
jgi:hypothetical protein